MSRIIKAGPWVHEAPPGVRPSELLRELKSDEREADDAMSRAQRQAQIVVRTAQSEARSIRDEARQSGFREGVEQGARQAQVLIDRLEADLRELGQSRAVLVDSVEEDVLKLCIDIVEKITRHEIRTDPRVVMRTLRLCLCRIKDTGNISVRVSPAEVETVRAARDELLGVSDGVEGLAVVEDRRVSPGGFVLEAPSGDLDARVETQIDQARRKLMETRKNEPTTGTETGQVQKSDQPA